ncbi:DUF397 domain-containing protein [Streptomyces sp. NPDC001165]|uniref:DUF397 domain-containing protein n=1 Tax=Streptomyces sp. NPDC001165 TaxID=3364546 RepID=UPI00368BA384
MTAAPGQRVVDPPSRHPRTSGEGGACIEVATEPTAIHIRDSKTPHIPHLTVTPFTWTAFLVQVFH